MNLHHADVRRILELLDAAENLDSLDLRVGEVILQARKPGAAPLTGPPLAPAPVAPVVSAPAAAAPSPAGAPAPVAAAAPVPAKPISSDVPDQMVAIRAPMPGTFFRTPAPDQPAFVEQGQQVDKSATLCLVEVMKMFNSVSAPVSGRVHSILVEHGASVDHNQILMIVDPVGVSA